MHNFILKTIGFLLNFINCFSSIFAGKLAILLFSSPQKVRLKNINSSFLKSANQSVLKYENISIMTYHWKGTKDTILLAHGWESNTHRWKDLIEQLIVLDYNVVALDAPAHGNTSGKKFNTILYSECINVVAKKFNINTIIGHSVGGMATVFLQHKYQLKSVNKLVLLGAPSNFVGVFDRYTKMMGYNTRIENAMNKYVLEKYNHLPEYFSAANFSKEITSKGLIIHDKKDRIIPYSDALDFQKKYSNAKLITTTGFGHGLKSEEINTYIKDFLNA